MKILSIARPASLLLVLLLSLCTVKINAQLNGIKTIPGNYATISAAVAALNTQGVGQGGVTFNVTAGYTETITARINLTATGTASNPIIFQKSSSGANPKITAFTTGTASPSSAIPDGIWSFQGCDYVTIDGIDLYDPNTTNNATMEYGYGLFRNSAYDGAQYNTIKNCTVTLNRVNTATGTLPMQDGSVCILVINSLPTSATSAFAPFTPAGTNSYNHFYSNTLQNCNIGIGLNGSLAATPYDLGDNGNDIGGSSLSTGNSFLNFGGGTGNQVNTCGVKANYEWGMNISYNTFNNNNGAGVNPYYILNGIRLVEATGASVNITNNTFTLKSGTSYGITAIYNGFGSTPENNTVNISYNTISNCNSNKDFIGIYNVSNPSFLTFGYNTISYLTLASYFYGIYVTNSLPVVVEAGNNHIFQITSSYGAGYSNYSYGIIISGQTVNCHDNFIDNITFTPASINPGFNAISGSTNAFSNESYTNNVIHDIFIPNASAGNITAINVNYNNGPRTVQNNQIYNLNITNQGNITGIISKGLITGNLVHDITGGNTTYFYGISVTGSSTVSSNQIYNISNPSGGSSSIYAILNSSDSTATISKNLVTNISSGATSPTVSGIHITGSNTSKYIINNFISDLRSPNSTNLNGLSGIYLFSPATTGIYNNTVYLNANSTGATFGSSAINLASTGTVDLRNNCLVNTSIPNGGGYTVALRRNVNTLTSYSGLSNNNNLYAGTPGLYRLIHYDGTNSDQTLAAFKARVAPRDNASVTENPPFINTSTIPFNLHLSTSSPTVCESHGQRITTPVSVPTDYDGDIRYGEAGYAGTGTAPDIGADEGNFMLSDQEAPLINYSLMGNSCTTGDRMLTATITDVMGVPTTGTLVPRIYYRKNSGTWFSQPGTLFSGTGVSGTWNFLIVAADMGGLVINDIVYYYVIAQDVWTPFNIGSNPVAGLVATNVNMVTTPPTTLNSYSILNSIQGVYQVGVGKTFQTLTAAAAAYNNTSNCLGTNVVFELTDASYSANETFPITFNANAYASASNTLTIRPAAGASPTISFSYASAIIKLNGAKYVIIDGSNSGGTDRNLSIVNNYSSGTAIWIASGGTGAGCSNITIKNCNLSNSLASGTYGIVGASSSSITSAGDDNDNIFIQNNNIFKVRTGIQFMASATGTDDNIQITDNTIGSSTSANYITGTGIYLSYVNGTTISRNTIFNIVNVSGTYPAGISFMVGVSNAVVSKNYIGNINNQGGSYSRGIYVNATSATSNLTFSNNVVCEIQGSVSTTPATSPAGMMFDGLISGINLWYNSIWMSGTNGISSAFKTAAVLFNTNTTTGIDVRNNIFRNSLYNPSNTTLREYAIYSVAPASSFTNINYNDYYVTGTGAMIGYLGSDMATLSAWQAATGQDQNSITADPVFVATNDLRPGAGTLVQNAGVSLPQVPDDFNGIARSVNPTPGAYEYVVDVIPPVITYTPLAATVSTDSRTLVANITDASGIPVSGAGLPVLYWKINSGSWQPAAGLPIGGGDYQFDFGAGVVPGDQVSYYIAAQDQNVPLPNVTVSPITGASGFTASPPAASTPPTSPSRYRVYIQFTGMILVGDIGTYPNLTGNSGFFKALNENVATGDMTVYICSDLTEDGANALNQWAELGTGGYTMTIRPLDKNDKLVSGDAPGLIRFNGADRVDVAGNYPGVDNRITFRTLNSGYPVFVFQNGATNITLESMIIEGSNTGTNGLINISTSTSSTNGNNHLTITNCTIRDRSDISYSPATLIYAVGTSGKENSDITISDNLMFNFTGYGIYVSSVGNGNNWTISNNHIYNQITSTIYQTGIYFYGSSSSNGNLISGNYIGGQDMYCGGGYWVNTGTTGVQGMYVSAGTGVGTSVQGNTIQNFSIAATGSCTFYGIYCGGGNNQLGNISGNTIGSLAIPASITVAGTGNVFGISNGSYNSAMIINNSLIANIVQTAAVPGTFTGIYLNGNTPYTVNANLIRNCGATSSSTGVKDMTGIYFAGAALSSQVSTISNNVISLGHGLTNNHVYKGIDDFGYSGNTLNIYFNSIWIGGIATGSSGSYAYLKRDATIENHRNNIYNNSRSGGTGKHYAIGNTNISGTFSSNYNDLYTTGTPLAIWNITNQNDIVAWRNVSGQDAGSFSVTPAFVSGTTLVPTNLVLNGTGLNIPSVTVDYNGNTRGNPPDIGAYEFNPPPKTWNGLYSTDWFNPLNWTPNGIPTAEISVIIPTGTPNLCLVNSSGAVCLDITVDGGTFWLEIMIPMTVSGNVSVQNYGILNDDGVMTVNGNVEVN